MDRRLSTAWEEREAARLAAKREQNEILRQRLLNPKVRLTGRDVGALTQQIADRKAAAQRAKDEDREYAEFLRRSEEEMCKMDLREREARAAELKARQDQWDQAAAERRELKRRELEEYHRRETHVGPSSLQQLDGEDDQAAVRRVLQQRQMRRWVEQSAAARERKQREEALEEQRYAESLRKFCEQTKAVEEEQERQRREQLKQDQVFNQMAAKQKQDLAALDRAFAGERDKIEMERPLLDSTASHSERSALGDHRFRPDHFRGLSGDARDAIRAEQAQQIEEKRRRDQEEKAQDRAQAQHDKEMLLLANHYSYKDQQARLAENRAVLENQQAAAEEKRLRREAERNTGPAITDEFFQSFGRSHR